MQNYLRDLAKQSTPDQIEAALTAILDHFGGLVGFTTAWIEHQERMMRAGGLRAQKCFEGILQMLLYLEDRRKSEMPEVDQLSREELGAHMVQEGIRLLSNPALED